MWKKYLTPKARERATSMGWGLAMFVLALLVWHIAVDHQTLHEIVPGVNQGFQSFRQDYDKKLTDQRTELVGKIDALKPQLDQLEGHLREVESGIRSLSKAP